MGFDRFGGGGGVMTDQQRSGATKANRAFLATYVASDASDRQIAREIRARLLSEWYRRERDHYAEWIDFGGES